MPTVTITFNLPEEQEELNNALRGGKYLSALQELDGMLRQKIKHDDTITEEQLKVYESVRESLADLASEDIY
jgi:hypothetical protein